MPLSPIDRTALTSRTFDAVKFIAAIMVVCSHYIRQEIMPDFDPDAAPLTDFIGQFFFAFTAYAMVPMFFCNIRLSILPYRNFRPHRLHPADEKAV